MYVALTRAKEKLVLTGMIKDAQNVFRIYRKCTSGEAGQLPAEGPGSQLPGLDSSGHAFLSAEIYARCGSTGKIVWEEVEQAADSRENYEELLQHIDHAKPELLQQYDQWFSYRYPYQSEAGKKVNIRFRN